MYVPVENRLDHDKGLCEVFPVKASTIENSFIRTVVEHLEWTIVRLWNGFVFKDLSTECQCLLEGTGFSWGGTWTGDKGWSSQAVWSSQENPCWTLQTSGTTWISVSVKLPKAKVVKFTWWAEHFIESCKSCESLPDEHPIHPSQNISTFICGLSPPCRHSGIKFIIVQYCTDDELCTLPSVQQQPPGQS